MKVRKLSISNQIFIVLLVVVMVGISLMTLTTTSLSGRLLMEEVQKKALDVANFGAAMVDADSFTKISSSAGEDFKKIYEVLNSLRENTDLKFVYALSRDNAGNYFFVVDTDEEDPAEYGDAYEAYETMELAYMGEASVDSEASTDEWGSYISAFSPILLNGKVVGIIGVDYSYDDVLTSTKRIKVNAMGIGTFTFILLLGTLILIKLKLDKNLKNLNDKVKVLAEGDGDLSQRIDLKSGDELEVIADNVNGFIEVVNNLVTSVATSSFDNADAVEQMNSHAMDLSANMEECSATSETVSDKLSYVSAQMSEFATEVMKVNSLVTEANTRADSASKLAISHKKEAIEEIEEINVQIKEALEAAKVISSVGKITEQINGIAHQTRILSINAQIEASRAGSRGKGFTVVAEEIAKLSSKTAESVNQIAEINETVQGAMNNLREYVEKMNGFMSENVVNDYGSFEQLGVDYGVSTTSIKESMQLLNKQSADIAELISNVDMSVQEISVSVSESAQKIESFSSATNDISENMQNLLDNPILKMAK